MSSLGWSCCAETPLKPQPYLDPTEPAFLGFHLLRLQYVFRFGYMYPQNSGFHTSKYTYPMHGPILLQMQLCVRWPLRKGGLTSEGRIEGFPKFLNIRLGVPMIGIIIYRVYSRASLFQKTTNLLLVLLGRFVAQGM